MTVLDMGNIDLTALEIFKTVVEQGGIAKASWETRRASPDTFDARSHAPVDGEADRLPLVARMARATRPAARAIGHEFRRLGAGSTDLGAHRDFSSSSAVWTDRRGRPRRLGD